MNKWEDIRGLQWVIPAELVLGQRLNIEIRTSTPAKIAYSATLLSWLQAFETAKKLGIPDRATWTHEPYKEELNWRWYETRN